VILPICVASFPVGVLSDAALTQPWIQYACSLSAERQPNDRNARKNFCIMLALGWQLVGSSCICKHHGQRLSLSNTFKSALFFFRRYRKSSTGNFNSLYFICCCRSKPSLAEGSPVDFLWHFLIFTSPVCF